MQSLADEDVLVRSAGTGQYRMGPRLIGIVERATQSFDYRAAAQPLLEKLRDITQETASLHILQGNRRICIAAAYTTQPFGRIVPIGLPFPLAGSAAGHALLSQLDPAALELVLEDICDGPEAEAVRTAVSTVRDRGYAESVNQSVAGVRGIALPDGTLALARHGLSARRGRPPGPCCPGRVRARQVPTAWWRGCRAGRGR
jgi:DNA-binding IclR family transcriptional regulator